MTAEEWDSHYWRIKSDLQREGLDHNDAAEVAERDTTIQFGERPGGNP